MLPQNVEQWKAMVKFLHAKAGVHPSPDLKVVGWASGNRLHCVVGFNWFIGSVCQIHVAYEDNWKYTPKELLKVVFEYAFKDAGREMVIGVVNSQNKQAMIFDKHLGFKELYRIVGAHDNGGDIVMLGMRKEDCRYLENENAEAA